ncbi:glycosyltransferase family 4 protein [Hymenobacter sp. IS2118]|uniref:glycosyltransferase family 4 protein n=1 Tax=Hymenobacter sp. IS2118 TaxID=1505605 RepID=UPI00068954A5|nr:glycosyltransferase family 4 protein [Hymenobacter sp. IS2118]
MKILLSAYACDPTHGGEGGNGFNWAWETATLGHEVWCLTTPWGQQAVMAEMRARAGHPAAQRLHFLFVKVPGWVEFLYRWQFGVYLHYMVWQYRAWQVARPLDQRVCFDLVHHVTFGSLQFASWLWRLGRPLIFGPVGGGQQAPPQLRQYLPDWFKTETMRNAVSQLLVACDPNVRQTLRHAALVFAANRETSQLAWQLGARHVELAMSTALPMSYFPPEYPVREPLPGRELRILWLARLFPRKGLHLVLEALGRVHPRVRFHLNIYGDGPVAPLLPGWIAAAGLQNRVTWHGNAPYATVRAAFLAHDLFMLCSLRDSYAAQYLESMAMGLPILTLDHHGATDFIPNDAGIKVAVESPEATAAALARAVEYLYDHPSELENRGRASFAYARQQSWPELVTRLLLRASDAAHVLSDLVPASAEPSTVRH